MVAPDKKNDYESGLKKLEEEVEGQVSNLTKDGKNEEFLNETYKQLTSNGQEINNTDNFGYLPPEEKMEVNNVKDLLNDNGKIEWEKLDFKRLDHITDEEAIKLAQLLKRDNVYAVDINRKILSPRGLKALKRKIFSVEIQKSINPQDFTNPNILPEGSHPERVNKLMNIEGKFKGNLDLKELDHITDEEAIFLSQKVDGYVDIDPKILTDRSFAALQNKILDVEREGDINPQDFKNLN